MKEQYSSNNQRGEVEVERMEWRTDKGYGGASDGSKSYYEGGSDKVTIW